MGQQLSGQGAITHLPEKLAKHFGLVRDSGNLTYEEFLARVAELNDITARLAAGQQKHLLFEVQPGSDATALWKVAVRVLCTKVRPPGPVSTPGPRWTEQTSLWCNQKNNAAFIGFSVFIPNIYKKAYVFSSKTIFSQINKETGTMDASRIMNLYQFIQLYHDISSQAAEVLSAEAGPREPSAQLPSTDSCQASMWMGRYPQPRPHGLPRTPTRQKEGQQQGKVKTQIHLFICRTCDVWTLSFLWDHAEPRSLEFQVLPVNVYMHRVKQLTDEEECCICMDGKADLILPCAHSFCQKCIDKWSGQNRNCPICRLQVTAAKESWVLSDFPTEDDIAGYILNLADDAGHPHRP
ncbi:unnamed protein product [Tetraodon nigroviridis]|uniref:RING finger protein 141 n=1 Tax=Tetraodon nigroviridis TaxID=99883 RepID=Q4S178_TETNG|nr:unnamed protein product [Tetraodon nigroviridis]